MSLHTHYPLTENSAKSLAQAILSSYWHAPPQTGNSSKSLAHCPQTEAILPNHWHWQFCQITGTTGNLPDKIAQHCPQTDNSAKSVAEAILPNHWHAPPHTGNSSKSLVQPSTERKFYQITSTDNSAQSLAQAILPNHWRAHPHIDNSAKSLEHHCPQTGNTAKSLAQAILPNHWHTVHIQVILPNHWHRQFCQITGMLLNIQAISNSAEPLAYCQHTGNSAMSVDSVQVIWQNCLWRSMPVIWPNACASASDL
jgi:hypothetical protein